MNCAEKEKTKTLPIPLTLIGILFFILFTHNTTSYTQLGRTNYSTPMSYYSC